MKMTMRMKDGRVMNKIRMCSCSLAGTPACETCLVAGYISPLVFTTTPDIPPMRKERIDIVIEKLDELIKLMTKEQPTEIK